MLIRLCLYSGGGGDGKAGKKRKAEETKGAGGKKKKEEETPEEKALRVNTCSPVKTCPILSAMNILCLLLYYKIYMCVLILSLVAVCYLHGII